MNTEPTISESFQVAVSASGIIAECGDIFKRIEEIREMVEIIQQANRKGYPDIVRDHANRIIPRIHNIYLRAQVAMIDAENLAK
jgi:hypothetical protein